MATDDETTAAIKNSLALDKAVAADPSVIKADPGAMTPSDLRTLSDILGQKQTIDQSIPRQLPPLALHLGSDAPPAPAGPPKNLGTLPTEQAVVHTASPPGDAVDAGLAQEEGPEQQAYDVKQALQNVHDPKLDAQHADEKDAADLAAATKAARDNQANMSAWDRFRGNMNPKVGKELAEQANAPLSDYLANHAKLQELQGERAKKTELERQDKLNSPDSDLTKTSALALRASGIPVPKGYTAAMFEQMQGLGKLSTEEKHKAAADIVAQGKLAEEIRNDKSQTGLGYARLKAEQAEKAAAVAAKGEKGEKGEMLPPEAVEFTNQVSGLGDLTDLWKQHQKTGFVESLSPFGPTPGNTYESSREARGGNIAAAGLPLGRETPEAVKEAKEELPSKFANSTLAKNFFTTKYSAIRDNAEQQIRNLEASGKFPHQVGEMKRKLAEQDAAAAEQGLLPGGGSAGARPAGGRPTRTVNGVTKVWNGSAWVAP